MPEVDDRGAELGIEHAREHAAHVVGAGGCGRWGRSRSGRHVRGAGPSPNKTSVDLENMPDPRYRQGNGPARGPEGTRRRDALLDVSGAGRLHPALLGAGAGRLARACTPTPSGCTSSASARPASSTSSPCTAARSAARARLLARAGRARPRVRPAQLHAARRAARRARRAGRRRRRRRHRDRPLVGHRGRPPHPLALVREGALRRDGPPRFDPGDRDRPAPSPTSRSCTARSGSWPRPTPSSSATSTAGICEGVVAAVGGGSSRGVRDVVRPRPVPGHRFRQVS